ncbi:hypothetical protein THII_0531 [Thioploca ingrica]|uniref:DUF2283 domain-containing protein n=1 Tax=Thioploca ingrica TaxID=40754 RepID=A0A090AB95_9GAMM|nr:hypothetical protein THII_0531 [Thioploca ingrica]
MKIYYDNEVDAVYIKLGEESPEGVIEMSAGINLDITTKGKLVGIEILNASIKMDIQTILSYSLELNEETLFARKNATQADISISNL